MQQYASNLRLQLGLACFLYWEVVRSSHEEYNMKKDLQARNNFNLRGGR